MAERYLLRKGWTTATHFAALDEDVDILERKLAEVNSTLRWILTTLVATLFTVVGGLILAITGKIG